MYVQNKHILRTDWDIYCALTVPLPMPSGKTNIHFQPIDIKRIFMWTQKTIGVLYGVPPENENQEQMRCTAHRDTTSPGISAGAVGGGAASGQRAALTSTIQRNISWCDTSDRWLPCICRSQKHTRCCMSTYGQNKGHSLAGRLFASALLRKPPFLWGKTACCRRDRKAADENMERVWWMAPTPLTAGRRLRWWMLQRPAAAHFLIFCLQPWKDSALLTDIAGDDSSFSILTVIPESVLKTSTSRKWTSVSPTLWPGPFS